MGKLSDAEVSGTKEAWHYASLASVIGKLIFTPQRQARVPWYRTCNAYGKAEYETFHVIIGVYHLIGDRSCPESFRVEHLKVKGGVLLSIRVVAFLFSYLCARLAYCHERNCTSAIAGTSSLAALRISTVLLC